MRSLNLNSPGPVPPPARLRTDSIHSPASPDLSPISTTSALLTPTDLSPATKTFDQKLPPNFDFNTIFRSGGGDNNSLMIETGLLDGPRTLQSSLWASQQPPSPNSGYFPMFEPFSESPSTVMRSQGVFPPSSQSTRQRLESSVLPPSLPPLSWSSQQFRSSDWLKADDPTDRIPHVVNDVAAFRSVSAQHIPPAQRQASSQVHEVGWVPSVRLLAMY